jgi:hypothetical protein
MDKKLCYSNSTFSNIFCCNLVFVLSVEAIDTPAEEETGHSASARIVIHVEVSSSFGRASYSCTVVLALAG